MLLNSNDVLNAEAASQSVSEPEDPGPAGAATGEEEMSDESIINLLYSGLPTP